MQRSIRGWAGALAGGCLTMAAACGSGTGSNFGAGGSGSGSGGTSAQGGSSSSGGPVLVVDAGGSSSGSDDGGGGTSNTLMMTIRDFKMWTAGGTNPDFENVIADDRGIVETALGADQKPVYAHPNGMTTTTHGQMYFDQWYNDVAGVNINVQYPIPLTQSSDGTYGYDSLVSGTALSATDPTKNFFPIDDGTPYQTAFGNQNQAHNYSFTTELHTVFTYNGGEQFTFSGDDDVFVFINGSLAIDLGGVHAREQQTVMLDTLQLTKGQEYPLDLFGAERHTNQSNVSFTTTLNLQPPPPR